MGVKSTRELTRKQAEELYVELRKKDMERTFRAEAVQGTDKELEAVLERMDDEQHDGESYRNYSIVN